MVKTIAAGAVAFLVSLGIGVGVMMLTRGDAVDLRTALAESADTDSTEVSDEHAAADEPATDAEISELLADLDVAAVVDDGVGGPKATVEVAEEDSDPEVAEGSAPADEASSAVGADEKTPAVASPADGSAAVARTSTVAAPSGLPESRLGKIFAAMQPREAARVLEQMDDRDIATILAMMNDRQAAAVMANLAPERAAGISRAGLLSSEGNR